MKRTLLISGGVAVIDLASKQAVMSSELFFIENDLGVFSWLIIFLLFGFYVFFSQRYFGAYYAANGLIYGGSAGNLIDRLDGSAVDWINAGIATINLADVAIWAGVILLSIRIFVPIRNS